MNNTAVLVFILHPSAILHARSCGPAVQGASLTRRRSVVRIHPGSLFCWLWVVDSGVWLIVEDRVTQGPATTDNPPPTTDNPQLSVPRSSVRGLLQRDAPGRARSFQNCLTGFESLSLCCLPVWLDPRKAPSSYLGSCGCETRRRPSVSSPRRTSNSRWSILPTGRVFTPCARSSQRESSNSTGRESVPTARVIVAGRRPARPAASPGNE